MATTIHTDVSDLYQLKDILLNISRSTEYLSMVTESAFYDFENTIKNFTITLESEDPESLEDFQALVYRYQNSRELFSDRLNCLLRQEIVTAEGQKNIYTLITLLEKYLSTS